VGLVKVVNAQYFVARSESEFVACDHWEKFTDFVRTSKPDLWVKIVAAVIINNAVSQTTSFASFLHSSQS